MLFSIQGYNQYGALFQGLLFYYLWYLLSKSKRMGKSGKQNVSDRSKKDIFDRLKAGEPIRLDDPMYSKVQEVVDRTLRLSTQLNSSTDTDQIRKHLSEITGVEIDETTTVFIPFLTGLSK